MTINDRGVPRPEASSWSRTIFSSGNSSPALCNEIMVGKILRKGLHIVRKVNTQLNTCHLAYFAINGRHCF